MTVNAGGSVVGYDDYYPYGQIMPGRSSVSSADDRYKFTGKERDVQTGYDYFGARYYDGWLGRFLSIDPHQDDYAGLTPYNYAFNNLLAFTDPTGMGPDSLKVQQLPEITVTATRIPINFSGVMFSRVRGQWLVLG